MKFIHVFLAALVLITACGCGDTKMRSQIIGTWFQGTNLVFTFSPNGSYTSTRTGYADGHTNIWQGNWTVDWRRLVLTNNRSNLVVVPADITIKISSLDDHSLGITVEKQTTFLTR
jgi:hypothetical protein